MAVNQERVRLLVDALRSGQYQQAKGNLANEDGYCCLGVACEVARINGLPLEMEKTPNIRQGWEMFYNDENLLLPTEVREWYGFERRDGAAPWESPNNPTILDIDGRALMAAHCNDVLEWDFTRIADGFERTYLTEMETANAG